MWSGFGILWHIDQVLAIEAFQNWHRHPQLKREENAELVNPKPAGGMDTRAGTTYSKHPQLDRMHHGRHPGGRLEPHDSPPEGRQVVHDSQAGVVEVQAPKTRLHGLGDGVVRERGVPRRPEEPVRLAVLVQRDALVERVLDDEVDGGACRHAADDGLLELAGRRLGAVREAEQHGGHGRAEQLPGLLVDEVLGRVRLRLGLLHAGREAEGQVRGGAVVLLLVTFPPR